MAIVSADSVSLSFFFRNEDSVFGWEAESKSGNWRTRVRYPQFPSMAIKGMKTQYRQRTVQLLAESTVASKSIGRSYPIKGISLKPFGEASPAKAPASVKPARILVSRIDR